MVTEFLSGVVVALVGAAAGYFLALRIERRKQQQAPAKAVYEACFALQKTLADWMNEIADATREEGSATDVLRRLLTVFEHENYQRRVGEYISRLEGEADCSELSNLARRATP